MPGILNYELTDYQTSARTYRSELLRLPILALASVLPYLTLRPGIRFEEVVGASSIDVELQPYKRNAIQDANLDLALRVLKTYFGTVNAEFDPNAAISTLLGHRASLASGDALQSTPQAHEVLALTPKAIGRKLLASLCKAKHNPAGTTTMDLFDGFDTITEKEIAAGAISGEKGNYLRLSEAIDKTNAVDVLQSIMYKMSPELRGEKCYIYCSQEILDAYNKAYKLESGAVIYNDKFQQTTLEGSDGNLVFVPMVSKAGSRFIHICPKENMLVGCDQLSDSESVRVGNYSPDTFMVMMRMFFGVQFESIDPRRFFCAEIVDDSSYIRWSHDTAPTVEAYPDGGYFKMATDCSALGILGVAGSVVKMTVNDGEASFSKVNI